MFRKYKIMFEVLINGISQGIFDTYQQASDYIFGFGLEDNATIQEVAADYQY